MPTDPDDSPPLRSEVLVPPGEKPLGEAIRQTLQAAPRDRAALFERLAREIEAFVSATAPDHPWTCTVYIGTDGSRVFRGGVGHSLVIDADGRLWRARSYEDFVTTYTISETTCSIESLTPLYGQMRQYLPR
ncbi:MAG TPA: hypothetical protein PLB01_03085 [Thermoanaerobaculia bacterium]|nr:hypothetical protein [Thermoanaerobaculia bacterium]